MRAVDAFRLEMLSRLVSTQSLRNGWAIWESSLRAQCNAENQAERVFALGEHLSSIFRENRVEGRGQASVAGGGAAWECLVTWYLNLVFWGTDVIATRQNQQFVPKIINNALTVTISNQQTNTESDIVVYRIPPLNEQSALSISRINEIITGRLLETDVAVVQCKTNWNDNAQVPMLWDLIYNSSSFRIPHVSVGVHGVNPPSFRRFAYSFMTVPTSKGPFNPKSLCVLRVKNMTGGNYWGRSTTEGVASCINEFFLRNFPDVFAGGVLQHINQNLLRNPNILESFLSLDFTRLRQTPTA